MRYLPKPFDPRALLPLCLLGWLCLTGSAAAQLIDLNLNDPGAAACAPGSTNTQIFDPVSGINEDILALTDPAGDPVFWELTFSNALSTGVTCTPTTTGTGFVTSLNCDNGLEISLPAGATDLASVSSNLPVTITAPAGAPQSVTGFSLTATRENDFLDTCQMLYEVEVAPTGQAFDLHFVLDKSGSMSTDSGGTSRWDALVSGVENFLPYVELTAGGSTPPGSQMSVTLFDSDLNSATTGMFDILDSGGSPTGDFTGIPGTLNGLSPGGLTAMGLGLQDAISKSTNPARPRVIVLFSDGAQNVDPEVTLNGCALTNPASDINPPDCPATDGHKIVSIGIGSVSGDYLTTLQNLGLNNRGTYLLTDNGTDFTGPLAVPMNIAETFQAAIGAALQDNSPQQVANFGGFVQDGADGTQPNVLPAFQVNRDVDAVALSFAFSNRWEIPQLLELASGIRISRDGTDVTAEFVPKFYGNFSGNITMLSVDNPPGAAPRDLEGEYVVSVSRPSETFKPSLEFRLYAYVEEKRFDVARTSTASVTRVNDTLDIELTMDWMDTPIEDADAVVRVFVPGADMGEALSAGEPVDVTNAQDAGTPGEQKYAQLVAGDPDFLAQLALDPNAVTLSHQGDGRYAGSFTLPDNVGAVHLVYDVLASDAARYGTIQRHWYESLYAGIDGIDTENSAPSSSLQGNTVVMTFTPRRPSGKLLGPGQSRGFAIAGATLIETRDLQNGTYELVLAGADLDTPVDITLNGDAIYTGPAGWGTQSGGGILDQLSKLPFWQLLLLILLVLLLLLLILRALRPSSP